MFESKFLIKSTLSGSLTKTLQNSRGIYEKRWMKTTISGELEICENVICFHAVIQTVAIDAKNRN